MPTAKDHPGPYTLPPSLLVCIAATVAAVGSARYWEAATGLSYWAWVACGIVPLAAGALIHRGTKQPLVFLGSRAEPDGVRRPGLGGLQAALVIFLLPRLAGDGAAALAALSGAHTIVVASTATVVAFAAVVLGYRAVETALNRRDAALAARQAGP